MTTKVIFNVDAKVKALAMINAKKQGITISDYLGFALAEFASGKRSVGIIETLNKKTKKGIDMGMKDFRAGKNTSPAFTNAKDAVAWLKRK